MQGPQMAVVSSVNAANSKLGRVSRWPDITLPLTHLPWVQCQVIAASCDSKHTVMPALGDKLCFSIITGLIAGKHWHRIKQKPLCMMGSQMAHKKGKESFFFLFFWFKESEQDFPFRQVCLPWSHHSKEGHSGNAVFSDTWLAASCEPCELWTRVTLLSSPAVARLPSQCATHSCIVHSLLTAVRGNVNV